MLPAWVSVKDRYELKTGWIVVAANRAVAFHCRGLQVGVVPEVHECFPAPPEFYVGDRFDRHLALREIDAPDVEDGAARRGGDTGMLAVRVSCLTADLRMTRARL
ncbi:hypothetical protein CVS37_31200 [Burkholderia lata]|nr:hypothetical protein CVS37_31200 [Burkholderia lata]